MYKPLSPKVEENKQDRKPKREAGTLHSTGRGCPELSSRLDDSQGEGRPGKTWRLHTESPSPAKSASPTRLPCLTPSRTLWGIAEGAVCCNSLHRRDSAQKVRVQVQQVRPGARHGAREPLGPWHHHPSPPQTASQAPGDCQRALSSDE